MTTEDHLRLFRNLKVLRKAARYTQSELASKIGMCRSSYNQLERGMRVPELHVLYSLSQIYHITMDALINCDVQMILDNYFFCGQDPREQRILRKLYSKLTVPSKRRLLERAEELYRLDMLRRKS